MKSLLIAVSFLAVLPAWSSADDRVQIDPGLQRVLGSYLGEIKGDQTQSLSNQERILTVLTDLKVSTCLFSSWLQSIAANRQGGRAEFLLLDRIEEQKRKTEETEKAIATHFGSIETMDRETRKELRELALRIAGNELSISEIKQKVLPSLFEKTKRNRASIGELQTKLEFLKLRYTADLESLCDRVEHLEAIVLGSQNSPSVVTAGYSRSAQKPTLAPPEAKEWRTVNGTRWEPTAYATAKQLCSSPTRGPQNVVFDTNVLTNRGWVRTRHYGDIWVDCSGRIVMVLRK